ncbi:uncharacterized protein VDAG_02416 [Verticillium dahliae VdLs.17]|uniref:Alginate lyase domain-containing protein n=1 Tax=Verticillium dahliae (strain VdLs.17 / ATCC MYA-4575 / FGSC 10137) TaxID=498257 RepID=G2WXT4_VERDV|nr:uncharacterized protein VDAG_02416 [Verticillium dahliae VdLs.17]EGY20892.1 hypothetical protein VDAG_02416 [Verticillium dahliae VdLs.17]
MSPDASYTNNAVATVSRSGNGDALWHDAAAAFNLALRWKISGDKLFATTAADILNAWADKLQALSGGGDDDYLTAGLQGYELDFLNHVLGSEHNVKHFFANWKLCNIASAMAIGVLADNQTVWDFAVDYFKNGVCNGGTNNAITNIVEEQALIGPWARARSPDNQGEDLFAYNDSRILLGLGLKKFMTATEAHYNTIKS